MAKRDTDAVVRYRRAAIWFTIALVLFLAMTPWPWMRAARPLFHV